VVEVERTPEPEQAAAMSGFTPATEMLRRTTTRTTTSTTATTTGEKPLAQRQAERRGYETTGAWSGEAEFLFLWKPREMRGG
jgi:hypothetical protein